MPISDIFKLISDYRDYDTRHAEQTSNAQCEQHQEE